MNRDAGDGQCDAEQFGSGDSINANVPHESRAIARSVTCGVTEDDRPTPLTSGKAATLRGPRSDIGTVIRFARQ
ncbi:hypothetical protein BHK69_21570 [Bosea vaviloviae]|uniref:Uncharacterized protein n=1 Tax=Bosea vaviloviae TaxID=1526658 RepID=A0A1D7U5P3_9HYPH|nr:hypothetical protein BHK69_21570 [Bosea vaviloviae]